METVMMICVLILVPVFISLCFIKADWHYKYIQQLHPKFHSYFGVDINEKYFPGWTLIPLNYYIFLVVPIFFKRKHNNPKLIMMEAKIKNLLIKIWVLFLLISSLFIYYFNVAFFTVIVIFK